MKLSTICLILSLIALMGCSTTPVISPDETKSVTPVEIREAAWSCQNSDMTGFYVTTPDYTVNITCS